MDDYALSGMNETSKFNSGALINMRLNNLWILTHTFARKGQYSDWSAVLDRLWCELAGDVDDEKEKGKEITDKFDEIEMRLSKVGVTNWGHSKGFEQKQPKDKLLMTKQYRLLMEKEIFLRKLQNKQGKGTAYYDESEDDWE